MAWDDDYDDYLLDEEDDISLIGVGREEEFFSRGFRDELDFELYEEEKEEADPDDFPDSFEEWKLLRGRESWEDEEDDYDQDLVEFEE